MVVVAGSGRTADAIASAARDPSADERAARIAASPLVRVVSLEHPGAISASLAEVLTRGYFCRVTSSPRGGTSTSLPLMAVTAIPSFAG